MTAVSPVFLIDRDLAFREDMSAFFKGHGIRVECFDCAEGFLFSVRPDCTGCIVLDMNMPGMSGSELQEMLVARGIPLPIIILAECVDVPAIVRAMKHGAYDFMVKPVDLARLLEQVWNALKLSQDLRDREIQRETLRSRISTLTERERNILSLAMSGVSNKEISRHLGISHRTVEAHRSHILIKLAVDNFLELSHAFLEFDRYLHAPRRAAPSSSLDSPL